MSNAHRRRDPTVELSGVGVGDVYWASQRHVSKHVVINL